MLEKRVLWALLTCALVLVCGGCCSVQHRASVACTGRAPGTPAHAECLTSEARIIQAEDDALWERREDEQDERYRLEGQARTVLDALPPAGR